MDAYTLTLYDDAGNPIPIPAIQGVGIKEIRLKEAGEVEDTYEIVLDDERVYTFVVKHGKDGPKGEPGKGLDIKGTYASLFALQSEVKSPEQGDMYNIGISAPYTIYMYDAALGWVSQGQLQGAPGAVFTPAVDASGNLSWTNNGGLANPPDVNIKGANGADYVLTAADKTAIAAEAAGMVEVPDIDTSKVVMKSGGTMEGALVANNTMAPDAQVRNIYVADVGTEIPVFPDGVIVAVLV